MNARLSEAVNIYKEAKALHVNVTRFQSDEFDEFDNEAHIGVEPMLLALSMELALKAWCVFDRNEFRFKKSHDLIKLFDELSPESQQHLDTQFKKTVAPAHPDFLFVDTSIRNMLEGHKNAFNDWRYLFDRKKTALTFDSYGFEATLVMVLTEFRKRYREVPVKSPWNSNMAK